MALYNQLVKILAEILDLYAEDITPDLELTPVHEVEPLQVAQLVIACEKRFRLTIHDEDVHRLRTLQDLARYIENSQTEHDGNTRESTDEERWGWYYS